MVNQIWLAISRFPSTSPRPLCVLNVAQTVIANMFFFWGGGEAVKSAVELSSPPIH